MIKRVIDVTQASRISVERGQLVVESQALGRNSCPIEDLGVLLLSNPTISITHPAIAACARGNVAIISCDDTYTPCAITLPLAGNTLQAKTLNEQIEVSDPRKKRLWQSIVKRKLREQGDTIEKAGGDATPITFLIPKVMSGDPSNIEGRAARIYWQDLFGKGFRRSQDSPGINAILNYGYAVLRAGVARAVVATGLCPSLGIHHCNQYNSFALVDDLVEPYRPWVDEICFGIVRGLEDEVVPCIDKAAKVALLGLLVRDCTYSKKTYQFMVALHHFVADFRENLLRLGGNLTFIDR